MTDNSLLIVGDVEKALAPMRSNYVDLVMTSPPYDDLRAYNGYSFTWDKFKVIAHELYRIVKPGGVVVWVVGDRTVNGSETLTSMRQAIYFRDMVGFRLHDTMIYEMSRPPINRRRYEPAFEYMFVMVKGKGPNTWNPIKEPKLYPEKNPRVKGFGRWPDNSRDAGKNNTCPLKVISNVWHIKIGPTPVDDRWIHEHPATYPIELPNRHIRSWTNEGDIVLDPFCGSGTTGKAALLLGRKFIGIDVSERYIQLAGRRIGTNKAIAIGG